MEAFASQDLEDYWNECRVIEENFKSLEDKLDDEYGARCYDEGEQEADWLRAVGLGVLASKYDEGKEVNENSVDPLIHHFPRHQAEAIKRRVKTLNATIKKKQRFKNRKPDIRNVFNSCEISSTGTRSRSATPDSLDSALVEDSPPSPASLEHPAWLSTGWPKNQGYHSDSRGSLDRLDTSPRWRRSPSSYNESGTPPFPGSSTTQKINRSSISISQKSGSSFVQIFHAPIQPDYAKLSSSRETRRGSSFTKELNRDFGFLRSQQWAQHGDGNVALDTDVEIIGYQSIGTLYIPNGYVLPEKSRRSESDPVHIQDNDVSNGREDLEQDLWKPHRNVCHSACSANENKSFSDAYRKNNTEEDLPDLSPDSSKLGATRVEFLGETDVKRLHSLSLIECTALFDSFNISFCRRKPTKRKKKDECGIFGVSLTTLLEQDRKLVPDCQVPLVFQKLLSHLEKECIKEEGILRVPGHRQKIDLLKEELENNFYQCPGKVEKALQQCSSNDLAAVFKKLLRDLPQPILTVEYVDAFYCVDDITDMILQIRCLNLLVLLLPVENRDTLNAVLNFLGKVVSQEDKNKMSLHNVAVIIAPNLFFPKKLSSEQDKNNLTTQVNFAAVTSRITKLLIKYQDILWTAPYPLVHQIRQQNENERYRRAQKENNKPIKKLLHKRSKETIIRKINNEVDFQEGILRVSAPQFCLEGQAIQLHPKMSASDIISIVVRECLETTEHSRGRGKGKREINRRALSDLAPAGNLSCILTTADPVMALQTHYLYEVGGNIGQRRLEHNVNMIAAYQENPNALWLLRCHHRNGNNVVV